MLRQQANLIMYISVMLDQISLLIAFSAAYISRRGWHGFEKFNDHLWILLIVMPCWFLLYHNVGMYHSLRTVSVTGLLGKLIKAHLLGALIVASLLYLTKSQEFSRITLVLFLLYSIILSLALKQTVRWILGMLRSRGQNVRHLLVVGAGTQAQQLLTLLSKHENWGLRVVGLVTVPNEQPIKDVTQNYPVLGGVEQLFALCMQRPVDEVIFCVPRNIFLDVEMFLTRLDELGITVRMVLSTGGRFNAQREIGLFHGELPILTFHSYAFDEFQLILKRLLDVVGAFVGLAITLFLFPFVAFAIQYESPGPVLFSQERLGKHGRIFKCWKFRSMFLDAEERKQALMALNEMNGAMFKIKDDPRVTKVGGFLRKSSIDELPQFWNVLCGDMSLVGTRPPTPAEVATYETWHRKRICIKPGITGLWQVSGRNQITDFDEVVRLDIQYIESWNIWLDIKILLKTIRVVLLWTGAR